MFGKIIYVSSKNVLIKLNDTIMIKGDFINLYLVFEEGNNKILGIISELKDDILTVNLLGYFENNRFIAGIIHKPTTSSMIKIITKEELEIITKTKNAKNILVGEAPLYNNIPVYADLNDTFSNHMAIFGNTGTGKSFAIASMLQNLFVNPDYIPTNARFILFDNYGEYENSFKDINKYNPNINFKCLSTALDTKNYKLVIPSYLLTRDDLGLILKAKSAEQLTILERTIELVKVIARKDDASDKYRNHIIASALIAVLYSNNLPSKIRNDIFKILTFCHTDKLNLNCMVPGIGYTRSFRSCFDMGKDGNFVEYKLVHDYLLSFIDPNLDNLVNTSEVINYTMDDLYNSLEFVLITESFLNNDNVYNDAMLLKNNLKAIIRNRNDIYFETNVLITKEQYINSLFVANGRKIQILNINLEDIDDSLATAMIKIISKMIFDYNKQAEPRAENPINIVIEEAHRYIRNDSDYMLLGYNIFERIAKEGRKYGVVITLISQRPIEISENVVSQCSNFMVFKINNPNDINYITKIIPSINSEIIENQKTMPVGNAIAFGKYLTLPIMIKIRKPNPSPESSSASVYDCWKKI